MGQGKLWGKGNYGARELWGKGNYGARGIKRAIFPKLRKPQPMNQQNN
jgi:hypothetical protein